MNEKQRLQKLIDENLALAEEGDPRARAIVINAQAELDDIANKEGESVWELFSQQQRNLVDFSLTFWAYWSIIYLLLWKTSHKKFKD